MDGRRVFGRVAAMAIVLAGVGGAVMYVSAGGSEQPNPPPDVVAEDVTRASTPAPSSPAAPLAPWPSWSFDEATGTDRDLADPAVIHAEGEFHAYTTSSRSCDGCPLDWVPHTAGPSLAEPGTHRGDAMPERPGWVSEDDRAIWAPAAARVGGQYLLYFAATAGQSSGHVGLKCLGVAVASTPDGPFVPRQEPLRCARRYWSVDPSPVEDGGELYLLWREDDRDHPTGHIVVAQLSPDGLHLASGPRALLAGEYPWEDGYPNLPGLQPLARSAAGADLRGVPTSGAGAAGAVRPAEVTNTSGIGPIENPAMARHPGTGEWLLTWSAHRWETPEYATGLAVCDGPLGPCRRVSEDDPWLQTSASDAVTGTSARFVGAGGLTFVGGPDGGLYAVFHAYREGPDAGWPTAPRVGWAYRVDAAADGGYRLAEFP